jgi:hypothetical protein
MVEKRKKIARHFHVVGGGCFGSQYVRWLLRARSLGMLEFEKIFAVDRDPNCRLAQAGPRDASLQLVTADWLDYLTELLLARDAQALPDPDQWVPSPLSPHILLLAFLRAAMVRLPQLRLEPSGFRAEVPTPVRIPLASGSLAVSFAEWQCPVNCIEPATCPAIQAPRTWDMKPALQGYFAAHPETGSAHVLQCRHFVHGVGTIPFEEILRAFRKLCGDLQRDTTRRVAVATTSGCHGLIGSAEVGRS